ncbi:hypothetical protein AX17_005661 [Amanita inopinata Kibby_2008]|nr:hypothetical protein AX17_005661 [Amanita inopinata Kibby_2008]
MPAPAPFPSSQSQQHYPALYLYPINDSFIPKHIALLNNQHVKIGRQTNAKTAPGERNGYFDSKVLSRQHAEVWEESGKIFIKDVKSSNGTFINGERLSPEGVESEPFELKSDDIVVAARAEQHQQQQQQHQQQYHHQGANSLHTGQPGPNANGPAGAFSFAGAQQRRAQLAQQGLTGMGGMGGNIRPPGKSGLSFDLIFSRLQGELQKTKDTGAELHNLTSSLGEIQDTLGGALPQNIPPHPHTLPPVRPPQPAHPAGEPSSAPVANGPSEVPGQPPPTVSIVELQTRLEDTQSSLASYTDKIRALENILAEQEALKREMRVLRDMMESREREMVLTDQEHLRGRESEREKEEQEMRKPRSNFDDDDDDDDDARSVATVVPQELERIDEEDEEHVEAEQYIEESEIQEQELETEEEKHRRREELGRPKTPEPTNLGLSVATSNDQLSSSQLSLPSSSPKSLTIEVDGPNAKEISEQVSALSEQVRAIFAVKSALEVQQLAAQATIEALEKKVETLEAMVKTTQEQQASFTQPPPTPASAVISTVEEPRETLTEILSEWKKSVQGQWSSVQEEWSQERERLSRAREEFEIKARQVDAGLEKMADFQSNITTLQQTQMALGQQLSTYQQWINRMQENTLRFPHGNGDAVKYTLNGGLVTPPSPRSQSSDSTRYRRRRRRSSGGSTKEKLRDGSVSPSRRSRSRSREGLDMDTDATLANEDHHAEQKLSIPLLVRSRVNGVDSKEGDDEDGRMLMDDVKDFVMNPEKSLVTPDPSVVDRLSLSSSSVDAEEGRAESVDEHLGENGAMKKGTDVDKHGSVSFVNVQAAIGVLVLSVAAAAVIWRVKPE